MDQWIIVALSGIPLIASLIPPARLLSIHHQTGFGLDSQVLCAMALVFPHRNIQFSQMLFNSEFIAEMIITYPVQIWMRTYLMFMMWVTVLASLALRFKYKPEEKFDANWVLGGIIGSAVLSANLISNSPVSKQTDPMPMLYVFCAYLDVVAWIPQYKLTLKKARVDWSDLTYIVGMFTYDVLTIAGLTFDYRLSQLYNAIGFNTIVLKFIFFCGFIFKYLIKHCRASPPTQAEPRVSQTNNIIEVLYANSEPTVYYSAEKILDNPIRSIPKEVNISMDKSKLMLPS